MANIANLAVQLTAKTGKFSNKMKAARRPVRLFSASVKTAARRAVLFAGALTGAAAAGLVLVTKKAFTAMDATGKLARALSVTTEGLVGLHHAAEINGTSVEAINKGLRMLARNVGDVATGMGTEAKPAFKELGLSAEALMKKSPVQMFEDVADRISRIDNAAVRAATAQKLFGRAGQELMNTLMLGRDGLRGMRDEADKLGLTFSRVDAAKIEAANDAITRMKSRFVGLGRTIATAVAPYVEAFADGITQFSLTSDTNSMVIAGFEKLTNGVIAVGSAFDWTRKKVGGWRAGILNGLADALDAMETWTKKVAPKPTAKMSIDDYWKMSAYDRAQINPPEPAAWGRNKSQSRKMHGVRGVTNTDRLVAGLRAEANKSTAAADKIDLTGGVSKTLANYFHNLKQGALARAKAATSKRPGGADFGGDDMTASLSAATRIFERTRTPIETYRTTIGELNGMLKSGALDHDTYNRAVNQARDKLIAYEDQLRQKLKGGNAEIKKRNELMSANFKQGKRVAAYGVKRWQPKTEGAHGLPSFGMPGSNYGSPGARNTGPTSTGRRDPQTDETNEILRQIYNALSNGGVVGVTA